MALDRAERFALAKDMADLCGKCIAAAVALIDEGAVPSEGAMWVRAVSVKANDVLAKLTREQAD